MARALKVFSTAAGFVNAVVAAPSQKAALEAWGVRENLFTTGAAKLVEDPELIAKALATPGEIVRVPIATDAGFVAAAKPVANADPRPPGSTASGKRSPAQTPPSPTQPRRAPRPKPPPDRGPLTRAEQALVAAEEQRRSELRALDEEQWSLEERRAEATRRLDAEVGQAAKAVTRARMAYEAAGGA